MRSKWKAFAGKVTDHFRRLIAASDQRSTDLLSSGALHQLPYCRGGLDKPTQHQNVRLSVTHKRLFASNTIIYATARVQKPKGNLAGAIPCTLPALSGWMEVMKVEQSLGLSSMTAEHDLGSETVLILGPTGTFDWSPEWPDQKKPRKAGGSVFWDGVFVRK